MTDTSTRSGMLWEVERILSELDEKPQILLMENVPQVHSTDNVEDFNKWQLRLEELGYKNYFQDLIATDYGIPQTRNRCFMISILGDYSYTFPKPIPLKLKLKDMLEDNVDEKHFLSEKMLNGMINTNFNSYKLESRLQDVEGSIDTLLTSSGSRCPHCIPIKNATTKGYLEAKNGDGIDLTQPNSETRRGRVQKEAIQTITTQNNLGVCVEDKGNYYQWYKKGYQEHDTRAWKEEKVSETLCTKGSTKVAMNNLRIRKLTPKECFRLMGVKDEDFEKCAKNQSDSSLYHLAGDSIVVNVIQHIIDQMID